MIKHSVSGLKSYKIFPDTQGNLDIDFSVLSELTEQDMCIEFEFNGNSYFLNAEICQIPFEKFNIKNKRHG